MHKNRFKKIGTSFDDEKETTLTGRGLRPWEQKVADEKTGKRKFHGAFTGGFVAGFNNTCGSEIGFTPSTFVSSRERRGTFKQDIKDFMDHEDQGEISLSKNLLQRENIGGMLFDCMGNEDPQKKIEYGPTMPPEDIRETPKVDLFGLGYQPSSADFAEVVKKPNSSRSIFKMSNNLYEDEQEFYDVDNEEEVKSTQTSILLPNLTTELLGFTLALTITEESKFPAPQLPVSYNPKNYLMHLKVQKRQSKPIKAPHADTPPLFAGVLSSQEISRIKHLKKFVKSTDASDKKKIISIDLLPFANDPIKNSRCFNFFCTMEGLEIGGITQAHLMTASQLQAEKAEFMELYQKWKGTSPENKKKVVENVKKSTERVVKPWKPSKLTCMGFNLPQPQVNIVENRPTSNFHEHVLPMVKSSNEVIEQENASELLKIIFGDLTEPSEKPQQIGTKRLRN